MQSNQKASLLIWRCLTTVHSKVMNFSIFWNNKIKIIFPSVKWTDFILNNDDKDTLTKSYWNLEKNIVFLKVSKYYCEDETVRNKSS